MTQQFAYHRTKIENIIHKMNARGDEFFEETIRLGRIFDLLNSDKIKADFQNKVIGDTEKEIDETVDNLIDWMVEQDLRTWQAVTDFVDRRRLSTYEDEMIGEISGQFRYDRRGLLEAVSRKAQEEVDRYDIDQEASNLSISVRQAVGQVALAEAGAVGLGAIIVAAASATAVDVTGILAASLVAGLGLFILPRKRKQSRKEFRRRSEELETRLVTTMNEQFETELARSVQRIRDAISPYTRFVRGENEKLTAVNEQTTEVRNDMRTLRHRIGGSDVPAFPVTSRPALETPPLPQAISESSFTLAPVEDPDKFESEEQTTPRFQTPPKISPDDI